MNKIPLCGLLAFVRAKGEGERDFGDINPSGSVVFHGGTLSLAPEW